MGEWRECKLGDIADVKGGKRLPKGELLTTEKTPHPYIRITDFNGYKINLSNILYVNEEVQKSISRYIVNKQDIILSIVGTIGLCAKVPDELDNANLTENCIKLVFNKTKIDTSFLYYHLISPDTQELIGGLDVGSTQPKLPIYNVQKINISLPPLEEQKAIAEVLSSLDDKIDLLHRQNKTLEELAQTLFRQWFIEEAVDDWEVGILDEILTVKGGTTPSTQNNEYWNGDICWSTPKDLSTSSDMYLSDTARKITKEGLAKIASGLLPVGTILLSSRAPVGYLAISDIPLAINQGYIAILDNKDFSKYFIFLWLKLNMEYIISNANGSTFLEISKSVFKSLEIIKPPKELREKFDEQVEASFEKIKSNTRQIKTLENMRDTLLPKLMSGEVRVEI